ncbi:MAG: sugar phosphate isomerase/epimerase family protein [Bacillota bacterium]|nr:sugar phosphate isomerase/epimerase family protein [Bacillota bacterium]
MRLSTSTCLFAPNRNSDQITPTAEIIDRCYRAGFKVLDMNFCYLTRGKTECAGDDWQFQMEKLRKHTDRLGMEFSQSHLPYYPSLNAVPIADKPGFYEYFKEMMMRAVKASAILGAKWAVVHPFMDTVNVEFENDASLRMNLEFYEPVLDLASSLGVGLAFENMSEYKAERHRRYCSTARELCEVVDAFDSSYVGACWDFGHANNLYPDQSGALKMLGKRLKATHVDDNPKVYDAHTIPYIEGRVNWEQVMKTLTEIGFEGDFTYESHGMTMFAPDELKDAIASFCYKVGMYCLSLA